MMSLQNLQAGLRFSHGCCCLMISTPKSTSLKQKDHLQIGDLIWFDEILLGWPWNKCSLSFMGYIHICFCYVFFWWNFRVSLINNPSTGTTVTGSGFSSQNNPLEKHNVHKISPYTPSLKVFFFVTPFPHAPTNGFVIYICVEFMVNKRTPQV